MQDNDPHLQIWLQLHQNQEAQKPLDLTNADLEHHLDPILHELLIISTQPLQLALSDLHQRPVYRLHSKILIHTSITENMRARLRSFLMAQTSKQCILRQTCVLACTLVDLYFAHKGRVEISQFQNLVIGCLILATKLKQGKFPMISYNIFNQQQLLTYQKKIAKRLNYSLMPYTYHDYAQKVIYLWDQFTDQQQQYNTKLGSCKAGVNALLRKFYQQLDCIYMVLKSLDYDIEKLVLNHFYLHARMIHVNPNVSPSNLSESNFQKVFYSQTDCFTQFYNKFLHFYSQKQIDLDPKMGFYLKYFFAVSPTQKEWAIKGNAQALQKIRNWDMIQTVPKDNYTLAKSVIQRVNKTLKN